MRKKFLSLALALALCLGLLPMTALAADGDFAIRNGVLTKYNGSGGAVTIPNGVTKIGNSAFSRCTNLTSVTIPSGVTSIKEYAFSGCTSLTSVTIPASVTSIDQGVFKDCTNLTSVTIPSGVASIENSMFAYCYNLTSVIIPSSVTYIDNIAFLECTSLTSVTIPSSVVAIFNFAFSETSITDVYYGGTEAQWRAVEFTEGNDVLAEARIHYNSPMPDQPQQPEQPQQPAGTAASPTNDKLEVNGNAADPTVYKINGSNYFKIRDVAALLNGTEKQFAVGYDSAKQSVTATTGQGYDKQPGDLVGAAKGGDQNAAASNDAIYVDGQKITAEVYKINGSNYFKLRDLGKALDFYVGWSADRGMYIETGKPYSE